MSRPLYVFDMDETLINADCAMLWNAFLVEKGIATAPDFLTEDQRLMALYTKGEMRMEDYLQFSMAPLLEMPKAEVLALVDECVDTYILPRQFPQSKTLIAELNRDGIDMVIISASVTFLVEAVARRIGIRHALGIDLVEHNQKLTSQILGIPSYREGKVTRLQQWLADNTDNYSEVHFFTDSINDLPLCQHADFAYLVNPCEQLVRHADHPNWQVLHWG